MAKIKLVSLTLLFLCPPSFSRVTVLMHVWYVRLVGFVLVKCTDS